MEANEMSDLELLGMAALEAMAAHRAGLVIGHVPELDVVTLRCAVERALVRQDATQMLRVVPGDAA